MKSIHTALLVLVGIIAAPTIALHAASQPVSLNDEIAAKSRELSPSALAASVDGQRIYIACAAANCVLVFDAVRKKVLPKIPLPDSPSGLVLDSKQQRLYVSCAGPRSTVCVIALPEGRITRTIPVGHTAMSPFLSPDATLLYVCNRFNRDVSVLDLISGKEIHRVAVKGEPVAAAITPDGKFLLVANHVSSERSDQHVLDAMVSLVDTASRRLIKEIHLPIGGNLARGVAISPDGRHAAVTHLISRYWTPATNSNLGGINCNAVSMLDMGKQEMMGTIVLDQMTRGAANPWAVTWTPDGKTIAVTHAGTHEVSLIEAPTPSHKPVFQSLYMSTAADIPDDTLPLKPVRVRARVPIPGNGPRSLVAAGSRIYVANYFSDNLCMIDLEDSESVAEGYALSASPTNAIAPARRGEMLFNDASLSRQGWQSCASCHDADARMDGINWDLLNDGLGNPKNTKSLLWAHRTPPMMSMGVRDTFKTAVRAGIHHILFTEQPEDVSQAMDDYISSLQPAESPFRINGNLSAAAERGKTLFQSSQTDCARCHPLPLGTDLRIHDVGTRGRRDRPGDKFDTPALVELWRTPPYLHDGSAATIKDVLTNKNAGDQHGKTSHLTPEQINDLSEYLLSL